MREADAQAVLLVQAFEEVDQDGTLLPRNLRERATSRAQGNTASDPAVLVVRRAHILTSALESRWPRLAHLRRAASLNPGPVLVFGLAAIAGALSNLLGPSRHVNVLAFPLLGFLAWNLGIYLVLALAWLRKPVRRGHPPRGLGMASRLADLHLRGIVPRWRPARARDAALWSAAAARFLGSWRLACAEVLLARARRVLHLGALALILGTIAGMYVRGLAFEYRATWESTFLSGAAAAAVLDHLLYPARLLTGIVLPPLDSIHAPHDGDAAPWIHLFTVTAFLWVVVPRALLAAIETVRLRRLAGRIPIDLGAAYFRRILAATGRPRIHAHVLPYSYQPNEVVAGHLQTLLGDGFGARAGVQLHERMEYGSEPVMPSSEEPATACSAPTDPLCFAILFALAQSPETEVHGRFLQQWKALLDERSFLIVIVDASTYRRRLGGGKMAETRLDERRKTWDRVIRDAGLLAVHVDLGRAPPDEVISSLTRAAWPPEALLEVA